MCMAFVSTTHAYMHRKEEDKFNVWLAYLNLENTYGEPPEEAALALFQRAAQACCPHATPIISLAICCCVSGLYGTRSRHPVVC